MFLSLPMAAFSWHSLILEARGREGERKRESERKRFRGTLVARFIDVFAPWMWQVLLGYLWTAELFSTPASGDKFGGNNAHTHAHTHHRLSRLLRRCRNFMNVLCLVRAQRVAAHWQRAQNDGGPVNGIAVGWKSPAGPVGRPWKQTWTTFALSVIF